MEITMKDIFQGYCSNYKDLKLDFTDKTHTDKKWTIVVLNYFLEIGKYLGFIVELEKSRYDLSWRKHSSRNLFLHLESENKPDFTKIFNELTALRDSTARNVIGVFYPPSEKEILNWIKEIKQFMTCDKEMLFILIPHIAENEFKLHGLIKENGEWNHCYYKLILDPQSKIMKV